MNETAGRTGGTGMEDGLDARGAAAIVAQAGDRAVAALAGGGGILAMAVLEPRLRRA
ncbi:MAG TPA: hypothetical protein VGG35_09825 [Streptosporangiaceae bacterium]|jgi:hypothetical protein